MDLPSWQWLHQHGVMAVWLLLLLPLLILAAQMRRRRGASTVGRRLPPSPPKLPLIGNLHQVGSTCPHRSLARLSQKHGPLMLLQLGQVPTLVVSSADAAEEIMKTHGTTFGNRPQLEATNQLIYGSKDLIFAPHGEYWRNLRKICTVHLLGTKSVQSHRLAREEEVAFMVEKIQHLSSMSGAVDLTGIFQDFATDLVSRAIHGRCFRDEGLSRVFRELMEEFVPLFARFHVGDYFPSLRWLSILTGLDSEMRRVFHKWERVLDGIIQNHLHRPAGNNRELHREDFVDILLALRKDPSNEFPLTTEIMKALLIDMLAAGTDTTYITLEWAMAELIRNSEVMKRAQEEVRWIAGEKSAIEEADAVQMSYLRAVIKETLRLRPPLGLLLPRQSSEDVQIGGYDIPKQTTVLINAWAIMRDPSQWEAPEEFRPERFLGADPMDFKGSDAQFIPFGAGRRICPGVQFAASAVELALANLLHRFDWELAPQGRQPQHLDDMDETFGLATRRRERLHLVPIPRSSTAPIHR